MRAKGPAWAVGAALAATALLGACSGTRPQSDRDIRTLETMDAAGLMRLAERFERAGDAEAARRFYREAAAREPGNPAPLLALAAMLMKARDFAAAETVLERARAVAPDDPATRLAMARLYLLEDRPEAALGQLGALRALDAESAERVESHNIEAVALDLMGRHGEALRAYAEALVRAPDDTATLSNMALSMAAAGEFAAARDILESLLADPGKRPVALQNLALVFALAGDLAAAERAADEALGDAAVKSNRPFYRRLASLPPRDRARAVFLRILPPEVGTAQAAGPGPAPPAATVTPPAEGAKDSEASEDAPAPEAPAVAQPAETAVARSEPGAAEAPAEEGNDGMVRSEEQAAAEGATETRAPSRDSETAPSPASGANAIPFYHLQIGSFSSRARAVLGWRRLSDASNLLAGQSPAIETVTLPDGRATYRLLIGPLHGFGRARALCADLGAEGVDCVVIPEREAVQPLMQMNEPADQDD